MSKCLRTFSRILPNVFVIGLVTSFFIAQTFLIFPDIFDNTTHFIFFLFDDFLTILLYFMWLWSWMIAIAGDPGRTIDDLKSRGVLKRIQNGDIPHCISHLQLCDICQLPKPPLAAHCSTCGYCHLRCDHHCAITGQCVADKNMKAFLLSFFYISLFSLNLTPPSVYEFVFIKNYEIIPLMLMIYGPAFFLMMAIFGFTFLSQGMKDVSIIDSINGRPKKARYKRFLKSFGNNFWIKLIPYQRHTTQYAWIGVNWLEINEYKI